MKQVILLFLQKVATKDKPLGVWQFSSKERKPISILGDMVGGVQFNEFVPGSAQVVSVASTIYTAWLNSYDDSIAKNRIDANGSNRFYLIIDESGAQSVVSEEDGLKATEEQMQGTSASV